MDDWWGICSQVCPTPQTAVAVPLAQCAPPGSRLSVATWQKALFVVGHGVSTGDTLCPVKHSGLAFFFAECWVLSRIFLEPLQLLQVNSVS